MKIRKLLCALALGATSTGALACEFPDLIQIPADESVRESRETLIQLEMIRYIGAMSSYVDCLREEHAAASAAGAPALTLSVLASRNNLAIAEISTMQEVYANLMGPLEELGAIETEACIDAGPGIRDVILDNQTIIFYTRRDEIFLNLLAENCPILRANNSSLEYTRTKATRFVEEICGGSSISDATTSAGSRRCLLGPFYEISESNADELRGL